MLSPVFLKGEEKMFTINGKNYEGAKYDFNTHCDFDALGVNVLTLRENPLPVLRAYLSISSGMSLIDSGKELEKHIINGGTLAEMIGSLAKEMNNSDFFMALTGQMKEETEAQETETKAPAKTKRTKSTKKNG